MADYQMLVGKKILFVVNTPGFFLSHRLPIALAAQLCGYIVEVATAKGPEARDIEQYGFRHHIIPFARSGQNPLGEARVILKLIMLFRQSSPDIVHLVTIKPVLYGGIAARLTRIPAVVAAVSGLGTVFIANSPLARLRRWIVSRLYLSALRHHRLAVIFQNLDDRDKLLRLNVLNESHPRLIRGSGVDLAEYSLVPEPSGIPVVVMASRLLKDKGVVEFVEAARILRERSVDVEMRLIGLPDPGNPTSVTNEDLERWKREGCVQLLGFRNDISKQYAAANIVCLPSYYGEGLPKTLIEAAACGRAVVTTDHPGCRDAIIPGQTGLLVSVRNAAVLADAIQDLIEDAELRRQMGKAGRALAEDAFAIEKVVDQHLQIYSEMMGNG